MLIYYFHPKNIANVGELIFGQISSSSLWRLLRPLLLEKPSELSLYLIIFHMFVSTLDVLPTQTNSSLVVKQQKIFLKIIIYICSLERDVSKDRGFNNVPNLVLMKRNSDSFSILNAIFETKREKLPISNHTSFYQILLVALAAFSKDIPIKTEKINILIILDFRV